MVPGAVFSNPAGGLKKSSFSGEAGSGDEGGGTVDGSIISDFAIVLEGFDGPVFCTVWFCAFTVDANCAKHKSKDSQILNKYAISKHHNRKQSIFGFNGINQATG
jgi:hypothetical protein